MATYTQPAKIPRWGDDLLNVAEPPEGKKDSGWAFQEIPPSSFENWKEQLNGQWWKWLNERLSDGVTPDVLKSDFPFSIEGDDFVLQDIGGSGHISFKGIAGDTFIQHAPGSDTINIFVDGILQAAFAPGGTSLNLLDDLFVPGILTVGDASFELRLFDPNKPRVCFDSTDFIEFDRLSNHYDFRIASSREMLLDTEGLKILRGLYVGDTAQPAVDEEIRVKGDLHVGGRQIYFGVGSDDHIDYDDTAKDYGLFIDGVEEWTFGNSVFDAHLNDISNVTTLGATTVNATTVSALGTVSGVNAYFDGNIGEDVNNNFQFLAGVSLTLIVNAGVAFEANDNGLAIEHGLRVGDAAGALFNDDVMVDGGINCGGTVNPAVGDGIFTDGIVVGFDQSPATDQARVGDANFAMWLWDSGGGALHSRVVFDANDYLWYDRAADDFVFRVLGTDRVTLGTAALHPSVDQGMDLGEDGGPRWFVMRAMTGQFHDDAINPIDQAELTQRNSRNCVLACAHFTQTGTAAPVPDAGRWNVDATVVRSGVGVYVVEFTQPVNLGAATIATPESANTGPRGLSAAANLTSTTECQVVIRDDNGVVQDSDFSLAVFGSPNTLQAQ